MKCFSIPVLTIALFTWIYTSGCKEKSIQNDIHQSYYVNSLQSRLKILAIAFANSLESIDENLNYRSSGQLQPLLSAVYSHASSGVNEYYNVDYNVLSSFVFDTLGINLDSIMNEMINVYLDYPLGTNSLDSLLNTSGIAEESYQFHIVIPYIHIFLNRPIQIGGFDNLTQNELNVLTQYNPFVAFSFGDDSYPIQGFDEDQNGDLIEVSISKSLAKTRPVIIFALHPLVHCLVDGDNCNDHINLCYANGPRGMLCSTSPGTNDPLNNSGGSSTMHDEIYILTNKPDVSEEYFYESGNQAYALVEANQNKYNYYALSTGVTYRVAYKLSEAISAEQIGAWKKGNSITLCNWETAIKSWGETSPLPDDIWFGHGGVYKLYKPGQVDLEPVYFSFPFGKTLWYTDGPDMTIRYRGTVDILGPACGLTPEGSWYDLVPEVYTESNAFYTLNLFDPNSNRFIATEDQTEIEDYWTKGAVAVGVGQVLVTPSNNVIEFLSVPSPPSSAPVCSALTLVEVLDDGVGTFEGSSTDFYEITKKFTPGVAVGTEMQIHVIATFEDGTEIDEYKCIGSLDGSGTMNYLRSTFRGKLETYRVELYKP